MIKTYPRRLNSRKFICNFWSVVHLLHYGFYHIEYHYYGWQIGQNYSMVDIVHDLMIMNKSFIVTCKASSPLKQWRRQEWGVGDAPPPSEASPPVAPPQPITISKTLTPKTLNQSKFHRMVPVLT